MNTYTVGIMALLLSAFLTAGSQVFYAHNVQAMHPFLFTGVSFFITACYFQLFSMQQRKKPAWSQSWCPLLKLNLASALTFMGFYFALKYVEPAIVSSLEMGVAPLFVLVLLLLKRTAISRQKWAIALLTLTACSVLMYAVITNQSGVASTFSTMTLLGITASICCGIGAVLCAEYSRALSECGWTSSMILAKRYIAIIVLSFAATYDIVLTYLADNVVWIVVMTVIGVLVPNYLLQKGIQHTNTFVVMMSLSFIPVLTFMFQLFDARLQFSMTTMIGVVLLFIAGVWSLQHDRKNEQAIA